MADFEFDFDEAMPVPLKNLLMKLIQLSKKGNSLSIRCTMDINFTKHYMAGRDFLEVKAEEVEDNAHFSLEVLELIQVREQVQIAGGNEFTSWSLFLTPKAFRWYEYHKANRIGKWLARTQNKARDIILGFSIVLSLILIILQIFGLTLPVFLQKLITIIH